MAQRAILSGISPVVIMSTLLALIEQGYGEAKRLDTILCTAACIEAVHVISLFVICFSIVFANGRLPFVIKLKQNIKT